METDSSMKKNDRLQAGKESEFEKVTKRKGLYFHEHLKIISSRNTILQYN